MFLIGAWPERGDLVEFTFSVEGSPVEYWVTEGGSYNLYCNTILTGRGAVNTGGGTFLVTGSGPRYHIHFQPTGASPLSTVFITFKVYQN